MNDPLYIEARNDLCCRHLNGVDMRGIDLQRTPRACTRSRVAYVIRALFAISGPDYPPSRVIS
jgi:hypothetical protein